LLKNARLPVKILPLPIKLLARTVIWSNLSLGLASYIGKRILDVVLEVLT
jgi:hypothetical protein